MTIYDFEDVFDYIGGFGPYQYILFGVVCVSNCFFSFAYFGQIFMVLTPPHHCKTSPLLVEALQEILNHTLTPENILNLTIPPSSDNTEYDKCRRYDINVTEVLTWESLDQNHQWPIVDCDAGWEYDFTLYYPSITSQLNWVCSGDWKPPFAQTCFFVGSMLGVPLFGWLADRFGRLPIIIITNIMGGIFGIASSFSSSFIEFCALRFIVGTIFDTNAMIVYILGLEFVSTKYRTIISAVPILLFLTGTIIIMPWIAYLLHDWTAFGIAIHTPMLFMIFAAYVLPESVRWLAGRGEYGKAIRIVKMATKINRRIVPDDFYKEFESYLRKPSTIESEKVTFCDLLKTPNLRKRFLLLCVMWATIHLAYDGHMRDTEHIGYNFFATFSIMGAIEVPAGLLTIFIIEWIGRKHSVTWTLILSGIVANATILVDESEANQLLVLAVAGRFLITISINIGMQYAMEVLPTAARAQGSAVMRTLGYGMLLASPYIVYLSAFRTWIPYTIIGLISIFSGIISIFLPETMGENLPDTMKDGEEFFKDQKLWFNPFKKIKYVETSTQYGMTKYLKPDDKKKLLL